MKANHGSSPIQTLPVELLMAIFVLASGPFELPSHKDNISPMKLLLVSKRWHDIALATASLWSSLRLDLWYCHNDPECAQQWTQLITIFLRHSENLPLSLDLADEEFTDSNLDTLPIYEQLIQHCHRWRSVSLRSKNALLKHDVFSKVRGALTSLQSLTLYCDDWAEDQSMTVFGDCPSLHHLDTKYVLPGNFELPWHQLTSWVARDPDLPFTAELLAHCDNLKTLIFENLWEFGRFPTDPNQVRCLTRIVHLSLRSADQMYQISSILDAIKAPLLTTLALEGKGYSDLLEITPIEQFLFHSACNLTCFSAKNLPFPDADVIRVLRLMPALSTLTLHDPASDHSMISQAFLKRLGPQSGVDCDDENESDVEHPFLPHLLKLELSFTLYHDYRSYSVLVDAILSRWASDHTDISRLNLLRVCTKPSHGFDDTDVFSPLIALRNEWLRFELNPESKEFLCFDDSTNKWDPSSSV